MEKIRMGVLCPSDIAFRRFLPSLEKSEKFCYIGIACATYAEWNGGVGSMEAVEGEYEKVQKFADAFGGEIFRGYERMLSSGDIDAVYIPLPPALHFQWAKLALENGKHVFIEKPFTTSLRDTSELIELAKKMNLAMHENYMFIYHSQLDFIKEKLHEKAVGEVRLIRLAFGFPFRGKNDFRYNKKLGGGALLDCGGYTLKLASYLLGDSARVVSSQLNLNDDFEVDVFGTATLTNDAGLTAQLSFGMDNDYKCDVEVWGSEGTLSSSRIFTAASDFSPEIKLHTKNYEQRFKLPADDSFYNSIQQFYKCVIDEKVAKDNMHRILFQASLVDAVQRGESK